MKNIQLQYNKAMGLVKKGDFKKAAAILHELCSVFPRAWSQLARVQAQDGEIAASAISAQKALEVDANDTNALTVLADYKYKSGDLQGAIALLRKVLYLDPGDTSCRIVLGEYYRVAREFGRALEVLSVYHYALPDNAMQRDAALTNLGALLLESGFCEEGLAYLKQALSVNKSNYNVANNLGKYYTDKRQYKEALEFFLQARANAHDNPSISNNLAMSYGFVGDFASSLKEHRDAIDIAMRSYPRHFVHPEKPYMDVQNGGAALLAFHEAMRKLDTQFFLAFGTLLGLVRDGKLLPFDKDTDVGVAWDLPRKTLATSLVQHGFHCKRYNELSDDEHVYNFSVTHKETNLAIDLFFFKEVGDSYVTGIDSSPQAVTWTFPSFRLTQARWLGRLWWVPKNPEIFLESVYGKDWRTPDPYFNTPVSGRNRNKESDDTAINFAYGLIFEKMTSREWVKTLGFCAKLLEIRDDVFIRDSLEPWLRERIQEEADE